MAASTGDKITDVRNAARPNSARATGTRSAGGTSLACDNLAGWPVASKVHFVTYQLNSSSAQVAGTQLDCTGIVSGNSIGSINVIDGTDAGNSVNDVVEMVPTAAWGQDLADALTSQHSRTGAHTVITATSLSTTGNSSIGGNEAVAGTLAVTGATTLTGAVGGTGYSVATISNPYKFSVYRNAALNATNGGTVVFDTKLYDTSSNYNTTTGLFTAAIAGFYHFTAQIGLASYPSTNYYWISFFKNGAEVNRGYRNNASSSSNVYPGVSADIQLAANDTIAVVPGISNTPAGLEVAYTICYFQGFLVSAT